MQQRYRMLGHALRRYAQSLLLVSGMLTASVTWAAVSAPIPPGDSNETAHGAGMLRLLQVQPSVRGSGGTLDGLTAGNIPYNLEIAGFYKLAPEYGIEAGIAQYSQTINQNGHTIGSLLVTPIFVAVQYRLYPGSSITPYVGAGVNVTYYSGTLNDGQWRANHQNGDVQWLAQSGFDIWMLHPFYINLDVRWVGMNPAIITQGDAMLGTLTMNPIIYSLGIGYSF